MATKTDVPAGLWAARPSREGKDPPNSYYAQIVERLKEAFPDSRVDKATLAQLKPFFLRAWRNGFNAKQAAAAHCACEDKRIVLSPGMRIELEKGEVRPPKDAVRGEVYEPSQLRGSASVERQKRALQVELETTLRAHGKAEAATERTKKLSGKAHEAYHQYASGLRLQRARQFVESGEIELAIADCSIFFTSPATRRVLKVSDATALSAFKPRMEPATRFSLRALTFT